MTLRRPYTTRLGILGGGQLAQMTAQAAVSLGIELAIFERDADSPASRLTRHSVVGEWDDPRALDQFAALCDSVTLENEFVDASVLAGLSRRGLAVYPTAETLARVQDKLIQKETMSAAGVPVPDFCAIDTPAAALTAAESLGWPLILKARRDGYDGYGNALLRGPDDLPGAWSRLGADRGRALLAEAFVPFARELAVMVVRGRDGHTALYPVVETVQQDHICHIVRAPAPIDPHSADQAADLARQAVDAIDGVGVFGVELFQLADGSILYNEIAPRPHNSGHYTIEACVTSQFENHVRAGQADHAGGIRDALAVEGAHLHLYGKREVRPGRKMGHITALGSTLAEAEAIASSAANAVRL
jgi:5-(carboxyamino)imidazole ribonucleotide synthase